MQTPYWDQYRNSNLPGLSTKCCSQSVSRGFAKSFAAFSIVLCALAACLQASDKQKTEYGAGLIMTIAMPEHEVASVVEEIAGNGIIRGTKEYNKDEYVTGAVAATTTRAFAPWTGGGQVFYKVREHAIDPRNFKNGGDVGTLAVRYVVQSQSERETAIQINAVFVEDFRRVVHQSDGTVESSEFHDIQEHLDAIELMKKETAEAERNQRQDARKKLAAQVSASPASGDTMTGYLNGKHQPSDIVVPEQAPGQSLKDYVQVLRKQAARVVKAPGAPMKSAPFQSASILQNLTPGTEVLVVISTPYWYGVETHDGQHGWLSREQLEQLP